VAASPDEVPSREEPLDVVLEGVVGSTAYGLANEDSDVDHLGIFLEPSENFLGLDGVPVRRQSWKQPGLEDRTLHEVGKFCSKVLGGNPTFTELLWLPNRYYVCKDDVGVELIELRQHFLAARPVRDSYLGYATQQFRKLEVRGDGSFSSDTRKRTEKHARHMARLLVQGLHAWITGEIQVDLVELGEESSLYRLMLLRALQWDQYGEERTLPELVRAFGKSVAGGDVGAAQALMADVERQMGQLHTALPEEPNRKEIDGWLRSVRSRQFGW
jgi:predicted nucleotidyltransferase